MSDVNRLSHETSPYLLQHADNPVDWYPWGEEALARAQDEDKPILLSIGYSACHWCHVMAHESFDDGETASLMNELYVNIKVDREERPDIDGIYQTAHQLLTHRAGGWPLTMFIDPEDQRPFFGGTYFPPEPRHGLPSFRQLLVRAAGFYRDNRDDVKAQGEQLMSVFARLEPEASDTRLDQLPISAARQKLAATFDREYGGIGNAPKFPQPTTIDRLLRHWRASAHNDEPDIDALYMATLSLTRMADGGIYDHVGGGFCRYAVDRAWQIPHFEKMLYDNGPLLALYAQAALATGDDYFAKVASETADWMLDDMAAPDGGFFSSRDADSEGEEGKFYVWTPDDVQRILTDEQYAWFARRFGLSAPANFEGSWHLTVREPLADIATSANRTEAEITASIDEARKTLFAEREKRIPPGLDDKQLTSWNALAIRGLSVAGSALARDDLVDAADSCARFLRNSVFVDGRLLASFKEGRARFPAYLDDYAYLLDALLELLQARWDTDHLQFAVDIADALLVHFYDDAAGGFWFTADDHEKLMHRSKPMSDDSTPSGNGIAAFALQRLGFLLAERRYLAAAEKTLQHAWSLLASHPHGHLSLVTALEEFNEHPEIVIIRGDEAAAWQREVGRVYAPRRLVFAIPGDEHALPGALAEKKSVSGETIAYRCIGTHCDLPLTDLDSLARDLSESAS